MNRLPTQRRSKIQHIPKTSASQSALLGQIKPIEVHIDEQATKLSPSTTYNRDGLTGFEDTLMSTTANTDRLHTKLFRATTGESNPPQMKQNFLKPHLKSRKSRFKINNKSRSGSNLHQLHLPEKKTYHKRKQKKKTANTKRSSEQHIRTFATTLATDPIISIHLRTQMKISDHRRMKIHRPSAKQSDITVHSKETA